VARDPYVVPPDRRPTKPLPREELAPIEPAPETRPALAETRALARAAEDGIQTMARCPCCAGAGMVSPEIALVVEGLMVEMGERR
jgi:hypothetical protein